MPLVKMSTMPLTNEVSVEISAEPCGHRVKKAIFAPPAVSVVARDGSGAVIASAAQAA